MDCDSVHSITQCTVLMPDPQKCIVTEIFSYKKFGHDVVNKVNVFVFSLYSYQVSNVRVKTLQTESLVKLCKINHLLSYDIITLLQASYKYTLFSGV